MSMFVQVGSMATGFSDTNSFICAVFDLEWKAGSGFNSYIFRDVLHLLNHIT